MDRRTRMTGIDARQKGPSPQAAGSGNPTGCSGIPWLHAAAGIALTLIAFGLGRGAPAAEGATTLAAQRSTFLQAEQALRQGDRPRYRRLRAELNRYPLAPYLDHAEIRQDLAAADPVVVRGFLERHADTPLADALARDWLRLASDREDWAEVIRTYRPTTDADLRCRYLTALLASGAEPAPAEVREVWLSGRPLPDTCTPVVEAWRATGGLTPDLVRARVALAMEAGQTELARDLARSLEPPEAALVTAWVALRTDPSGLTGLAVLDEDRPETRRVVVDTLVRWARRDADGAAQAWETVRPRYAFSAEERASVQKAVGRGLARKDDGRALAWLADIPEADADAQVRESAVLSALRLGRWGSALDGLRRMPLSERESDRWRYWTARATAEAGDPGEASALYAAVSSELSVYGFLAADRLERDYALTSVPLAVAPEAVAQAEALPGAERARELRTLGRSADARREWARLLRDQPTERLPALATVAHRWGWHDQAITALGRAREFRDLDLRFPLAHRQSVLEHAAASEVDPAWAYGVLRQESAFWADARSSAGALGLMQLLPSTAREVARRLKLRVDDADLLDADTNIRLGTAYLRRLLDGAGGHLLIATTAYNAGPQRARGWLPEAQAVPADLWMESIPFAETQSYVQRVLAYTVVYRDRLGLPPERLSARLPAVRPRAERGRRCRPRVCGCQRP